MAAASKDLDKTMTTMPLLGMGSFIGLELEKMPEKERHSLTFKTLIQAIKCGYRHFDLAELYNNTAAVSEALAIALSPIQSGGFGLSREALWLTMKVPSPDPQKIAMLLANMNLDYFDTLMIHFPLGQMFESEASLKAHWALMQENLLSGQARTLGVSNFYPPHINRLMDVCNKYGYVPPQYNQVEASLLSPNTACIEVCKHYEIQPIAYSPLGYGAVQLLLTNETLLEVVAGLNALEKTTTITAAQVALSYLMSQNIAVIPKTKTPEHMLENMGACQVKLNGKQLDKLCSAAIFDGLSDTAINCRQHGEKLFWTVKPDITQATELPFFKKSKAVDDSMATTKDDHKKLASQLSRKR